MEALTCSRPGCARPIHNGGLCLPCLRGAIRRTKPSDDRKCVNDGCNRRSRNGIRLCLPCRTRAMETGHIPNDARSLGRFLTWISKQRGDGCWEWKGSIDKHGYSWLTVSHKAVRANRFSYQLHYGVIPGDLFVCHRCDNRSCVNPAHLFLGTAVENNLDRDRKGRQARGETSAWHKLTEKEVLEIRSLTSEGESDVLVARRFGISRCTVRDIRVRRTWRFL